MAMRVGSFCYSRKSELVSSETAERSHESDSGGDGGINKDPWSEAFWKIIQDSGRFGLKYFPFKQWFVNIVFILKDSIFK